MDQLRKPFGVPFVAVAVLVPVALTEGLDVRKVRVCPARDAPLWELAPVRAERDRRGWVIRVEQNRGLARHELRVVVVVQLVGGHELLLPLPVVADDVDLVPGDGHDLAVEPLDDVTRERNRVWLPVHVPVPAKPPIINQRWVCGLKPLYSGFETMCFGPST